MEEWAGSGRGRGGEGRRGGREGGDTYAGAQFSNEIYTQSKQNSVIRGPPPINLDPVPAL